MKRFYISAVILCSAALLVVSCGQDPTTDPVNPDNGNKKEEVQPVTKTLTFVLPANSISGKAKWVAGDEIVVHGEYAADQVTVKLEAGDISADGKSATKTVDNLKPYVRDDVSSTLYAGYPASEVNNLKHCFFYTQFKGTEKPVMAACNGANDDTFRFVDLNAAISFTLDGDYDTFTLSGNKKETLSYGVFQVKITPEEQDYTQYLNDASLSIDGCFHKGQNTVYLPGNVSLASGYTVKFMKNGKSVAIMKTSEEETFAPGKALELGDVNAKVQPYDDPFDPSIVDIDASGNANCYILTNPGSYKFKAVYGNNDKNYVLDVANAVVLWETWNDDSEVEAGSIIASVSYAEDFVIFKTPAELHPGNAVIALRDEDGKILWSWHIWVPKTQIQTGDYGNIMGATLMDRNLGALVVAEDGDDPVDPLSYGLGYQWGRKDPFTAAGKFNSGDQATWAGMDEEVAPGQISLADAIANPRLLGHTNDGNWMNEVDETLWSDDGKTIYDPCPVGYRVPPRNSSLPFWASNLTTQTGWDIDGTNGWLTIGDPVAVFPIAGYRDDYDVSGMAKVGKRTLYWTAHGSDAKGACADLRYDKGTYKLGSAPKARLGSVRCIAE